ncbi:Gag polyprotein, partial [Heterocephalus glaber]
YIPFSTSDLYNWKHQNPPFSEKPQALISLLESVFNTHDPTWDDCQQLLQALFTSEERERIRGQAIKSMLGGSKGPLNKQQRARIEAQLPSIHPRWQANSSVHQLQSELHETLRKKMTSSNEKLLQPLPYKPGDLVFIHRFDSKTLEPRWKGPVPVVLSTPLAVKVAGHSAWIHRNHLKPGPPTDTKEDKWKITSQPGDPKLRLERIGNASP